MNRFGALIALAVLMAAAKQDRVKVSIAIVATVLLMGGFSDLGPTVTNILSAELTAHGRPAGTPGGAPS
jgi:hypothetical protein